VLHVYSDTTLSLQFHMACRNLCEKAVFQNYFLVRAIMKVI
jgi:hypothetical protein